MARERVPRPIHKLHAYINTSTDFLLEGGALKNWQRLNLDIARLNKWVFLHDEWNKYYALYINANTRSRGVRDNLLRVKKEFISLTKPVLEMMSGASAATISDFETLNIKRGILQKKTKTLTPVPNTHPVITFIDINEKGQHTLRIKDSVAGNRAKPFGVIACEIAYFIGEKAPKSVDECKKRTTASHSKFALKFSNSDSGKQVFYFIRWVNRRGEPGGWSQMFSSVIL